MRILTENNFILKRTNNYKFDVVAKQFYLEVVYWFNIYNLVLNGKLLHISENHYNFSAALKKWFGVGSRVGHNVFCKYLFCSEAFFRYDVYIFKKR